MIPSRLYRVCVGRQCCSNTLLSHLSNLVSDIILKYSHQLLRKAYSVLRKTLSPSPSLRRRDHQITWQMGAARPALKRLRSARRPRAADISWAKTPRASPAVVWADSAWPTFEDGAVNCLSLFRVNAGGKHPTEVEQEEALHRVRQKGV